MSRGIWVRWAGVLTTATVLLSAAQGAQPASAEPAAPAPVVPVVSAPLSALAPVAPGVAQGLAQVRRSANQPAAVVAFAGLSSSGSVPSDSDIAVGPTAVLEIAQPDLQVFSLTGMPLTSAAPVNTLWADNEPAGTDGPCSEEPTGDWSQVVYDQLAGQFVYARTVHVNVDGVAEAYECLAASETSDPTGAWFTYTVPLASGNDAQTDYPQLGFNSQAYYLSVNLWDQPGGEGDFEGNLLVAYNRADLLAGSPLQDATAELSSAYESYTPATLEGQTPEPAGSPELYMGGPSDALVEAGGQSSTLTYFQATPDWSTGQLLLQGPGSAHVGPYNLDPCPQVPNCAPQPGTSTELEAWTDNLMLPLVYRNFGTYQSLVGTFDVDASGYPEPEWFEFRLYQPGGATLYQEAVYAPNTASRYDQSIAEDNDGDIVLAYSTSSSTVYPSIAAAAHLPGMAAGAMSPELTLFAGGASQTSSSVGLPAGATPSRWGDASYLALAPNGCTLWYSNTYYPSTTAPWQTEIMSGTLPGCS